MISQKYNDCSGTKWEPTGQSRLYFIDVLINTIPIDTENALVSDPLVGVNTCIIWLVCHHDTSINTFNSGTEWELTGLPKWYFIDVFVNTYLSNTGID